MEVGGWKSMGEDWWFSFFDSIFLGVSHGDEYVLELFDISSFHSRYPVAFRFLAGVVGIKSCMG